MDQSTNDRTSSWSCCCRGPSTRSEEAERPEIATLEMDPKLSVPSSISAQGESVNTSAQLGDECRTGFAENTLAHQVLAESTLACQVEAMTISTVESSGGEACSCSSENTPGEVDTKGDDLCNEEHSLDERQGRAIESSKSLRPGNPCEVFLMEMLSSISFNLRQIRHAQQWFVYTVDCACRLALGGHFERLSLVGSVALCVETPGSDVDVVCLTQSCGGKAPGLPGDCLRRISETLRGMLSHYGSYYFSANLIEDARVPILRAIWGPPGYRVIVDILVDQRRPLDHVWWFQQVHATPLPSFTVAPVMTLVTITLRCVKWWLRQRQLPSTKEGGLPTLVWLLLALHSLTAAGRGPGSEEEPEPEQLVESLGTFFHTYATMRGLDGVLTFEEGSSISTFSQRPKNVQSPWAELSVMDPTLPGENSEIAPRLLPATQLLIAYELRRASSLLAASSSEGENVVAEGGPSHMRQVFQALPEGNNSLPATLPHGQVFAAIFLLGDPTKGLGTLELGIIEKVNKHPDWKASFLIRSDTRSEIFVKMLDLDEDTGGCQFRHRGNADFPLVLCPCHFVSRVKLTRSHHKNKKLATWLLDDEGVERFKSMRRYLKELSSKDTGT